MKKAIVLLTHLFLLLMPAKGQYTKSEQRSHQIIDQRKIELNGGLRSTVGGKSRTFIKIDLAPNTKKWYYSSHLAKSKARTR